MSPTGRITYRLDHAERVELVVPDLTVARRGRPVVRPLVREGDAFTGQAPQGWRELHLLLTLGTGRATWDRWPR